MIAVWIETEDGFIKYFFKYLYIDLLAEIISYDKALSAGTKFYWRQALVSVREWPQPRGA